MFKSCTAAVWGFNLQQGRKKHFTHYCFCRYWERWKYFILMDVFLFFKEAIDSFLTSCKYDFHEHFHCDWKFILANTRNQNPLDTFPDSVALVCKVKNTTPEASKLKGSLCGLRRLLSIVDFKDRNITHILLLWVLLVHIVTRASCLYFTCDVWPNKRGGNNKDTWQSGKVSGGFWDYAHWSNHSFHTQKQLWASTDTQRRSSRPLSNSNLIQLQVTC